MFDCFSQCDAKKWPAVQNCESYSNRIEAYVKAGRPQPPARPPHCGQRNCFYTGGQSRSRLRSPSSTWPLAMPNHPSAEVAAGIAFAIPVIKVVLHWSPKECRPQTPRPLDVFEL